MDLNENFDGDQIQHWYYWHKYKSIKKMILVQNQEDIILADIGSGTAPFSRQIKIDFPNVQIYAVDINYSSEDLKKSEENFNYVTELPSGVTPSIFLLNDVLEHIEDDLNFLSKIAAGAKKNSIFIITVPALKILWTGHDVYLKHFRRYNSRELYKLLTSCNLQVKSSYYIFGAILPLALMRKIIFGKKIKSQLKNNGAGLNLIFKFILMFDPLISRVFNSGVSLVALAEKK
jgi:hypothetical protein